MKQITFVTLFLFAVYSCTNTRYITDQGTVERQQEMKGHRTGINVGDIFLNIISLFISSSLDIDTEFQNSERLYRRMKIINESPDTLLVNMVTDVFWDNEEYNDILGIQLPPMEKQKFLVPYPVAYNIYFKTNYSEEEKLEITTDRKRRKIKLRSGMTLVNE